MAILKKYNLAGKEVGEVTIADDLVKATANLQMVKDYLVALRNNARQWTAHTKGRSEVNHTGKKPHPQKGTGRARQGCLAAPQYKGGGRVHSPRAKFDQHVRINKKERRSAIRHLLAEKIQANRLHVLQFETFDAPKTSKVADFLKARELVNKRVLFLGEGAQEAKEKKAEDKYDGFNKSIRNLQKIEFMLVPNISGYDVGVTQDVFIMDSAIDDLMVLLGGRE